MCHFSAVDSGVSERTTGNTLRGGGVGSHELTGKSVTVHSRLQVSPAGPESGGQAGRLPWAWDSFPVRRQAPM